jgi:hypothetical protein
MFSRSFSEGTEDNSSVSKSVMRLSLIILALTLGSCTRLPRNTSTMTAEQLVQRSTHVFIGVIESTSFPNRFLFRVSGKDGQMARHTHEGQGRTGLTGC